MNNHMKIKSITRAKPVLEGAGVRLKRALGFSPDNPADPFLLLDHFKSNDPADYVAGFPWHPHRGIETITYMLEGAVEHGDSMGNSGVISQGDVQWMTAGSGIIHQEMPKGGAKGAMHGFQLWANLPAKNKMMEPRYREVKSSAIPVVKTDGAIIRVVAGKIDAVTGPVKDIVIAPEYMDITLEPGIVFTRSISPDHAAMAFIFEGSGNFGEQAADFTGDPEKYYAAEAINDFTEKENLVIFSGGDGITVKAGIKGARFLLISGKPLKEPVAWYGPIVMNTREELRVAFDEYENGTFLKHKKT